MVESPRKTEAPRSSRRRELPFGGVIGAVGHLGRKTRGRVENARIGESEQQSVLKKRFLNGAREGVIGIEALLCRPLLSGTYIIRQVESQCFDRLENQVAEKLSAFRRKGVFSSVQLVIFLDIFPFGRGPQSQPLRNIRVVIHK